MRSGQRRWIDWIKVRRMAGASSFWTREHPSIFLRQAGFDRQLSGSNPLL